MGRLLFCAALVLAASSVRSQQFERLVTSPYLPQPTGSVAGAFDADGDGRNDLLFSTPMGLQFYRNLGALRFELQHTSPLSVSNMQIDEVADLDGDGDLDFVHGKRRFENIGGGAFDELPQFPVPFGHTAKATLADIDGDGDTDALIANGQITVLVNDGTGTFTDNSTTALANVQSTGRRVQANDADRDGDVDLIVEGYAGSGVRLLRNDGTGVFSEQAIDLPPGFLLLPFWWIYDIDRDLDDDLVFVDAFLPLTVMLNDGNGNYTVGPSPPDAPEWNEIGGSALADWDSDGRKDLLWVAGFYGLGGGSPFHFRPFPANAVLGFAVPVDLDGDLDVDLVGRDGDHMILMNAQGGAHNIHRLPAVRLYEAELPLDIRRYEQPAPPWTATIDLLMPSSGVPNLVADQSVGSFDPGYRPLHLTYFAPDEYPTDLTVRDAAVLDRFTGATGFVMCTDEGPRMFMEDSNGLVDVTVLLPTDLGAPSNVGVGNFTGLLGSDLVFGDTSLDGPRILLRNDDGLYDEQPVTLPTAATHACPAFESVTICDIDGDDDLDIVHELRVLTNPGDGSWIAGPGFGQWLSQQSEQLLPIDYDNDGDLDLLSFGENTPTQLLANDNGVFQEVTIGTLPPLGFAATDMLSVDDSDGDGDDDILVARGLSSDLLRNDGGVFTLIGNVGPRGLLIDVNHDHRADLLTGDDVLINRHAHLHAVHATTPSLDWELQVHAFRTGPVANLAVVAISTGETFVELPGIGDLYVDLAQADLFPVTLTNGLGSTSFAIPFSPLVIGIDVIAQAVIVEAAGLTLTSVVRDRVR